MFFDHFELVKTHDKVYAMLDHAQNEKQKELKVFGFFFLQYDKFSSVSIDNFIKHKPLISGGAGLLLRCVIASCWEVDIFLGRLYTQTLI